MARRTWATRLKALARALGIDTDHDLARALGVSTCTLRSWRSGRTKPRGPALKHIEAREKYHVALCCAGDEDPDPDADYWAYLDCWRERLPSVGEPFVRWRRREPSEERRCSLRWVRRLRAPRYESFPLVGVAAREGLTDEETVVLAAVLLGELDAREEEGRHPFMRRREGVVTGAYLLDAITSARGEYARKSALLSAEGKLRTRGLIAPADGTMPLMDEVFTLAASARHALIMGLPEGLVARRAEGPGLCRVETPTEGLDRLIVAPAVREQLADALAFIRNRETVMGRMGFGRVLSSGAGSGAALLFHGSPGTGKTLAARVIAHETGRALWTTDFARVESMWVGQTEKRLTRLFRDAAHADPVLLIDEADGLLATRGMAARGFEIRHVNVILQEIERSSGVVVLTTNNAPVLDRALERRLFAVVEFPRPERAEREAIWRLHVPPEAVGDGHVDFAPLARHELTGGQIRQAVLTAATAAVRREGEAAVVTQRDLESAARAFVKATPRIGFGQQALA